MTASATPDSSTGEIISFRTGNARNPGNGEPEIIPQVEKMARGASVEGERVRTASSPSKAGIDWEGESPPLPRVYFLLATLLSQELKRESDELVREAERLRIAQKNGTRTKEEREYLTEKRGKKLETHLNSIFSKRPTRDRWCGTVGVVGVAVSRRARCLLSAVAFCGARSFVARVVVDANTLLV